MEMCEIRGVALTGPLNWDEMLVTKVDRWSIGV